MATLEPKEWAAASQKWPVDIRNSKSKNGAAVKATDKKRASLYNLFLLFYDQTLKQFIFLFADSLSPKSCEEFSFGTFWRRRRFSFFFPFQPMNFIRSVLNPPDKRKKLAIYYSHRSLVSSFQV